MLLQWGLRIYLFVQQNIQIYTGLEQLNIFGWTISLTDKSSFTEKRRSVQVCSSIGICLWRNL